MFQGQSWDEAIKNGCKKMLQEFSNAVLCDSYSMDHYQLHLYFCKMFINDYNNYNAFCVMQVDFSVFIFFILLVFRRFNLICTNVSFNSEVNGGFYYPYF